MTYHSIAKFGAYPGNDQWHCAWSRSPKSRF